MSRFLRPAFAILSVLIIGISAFATQTLYAQDAPIAPPLRRDYAFIRSASCLTSPSAVCARKPKAPPPVDFATATLRIEGQSDKVRVEARGSTIAEVLVGLGTTFNVRYHSPVVLDQVVNGTYSGPLRRVIARVLSDYNYVIKYENSQPDLVMIFGKIGERAAPAVLTPTAVTTTPAAVTTPATTSAHRRRNTSPNRPQGEAGR